MARIVARDNGVMTMLVVVVMVVAAVLVAVSENGCVGSLWMALLAGL